MAERSLPTTPAGSSVPAWQVFPITAGEIFSQKFAKNMPRST
jgi:hypothetical protein